MTRKNIFLIVAIVCFLGTAPKAYTQTAPATLTLRQSVDVAIANNLQVRQTDILMQNAHINLRQAKTNRMPDLFGNLNHGINQGRSIDPFTNSYINQKIFYGNYSLGTNVTLFNGLQLKNLVKQNALIYEASRLELQQARDELTLNVVLAYLQILNNEDQLQQALNQVEVSKKQVERLEVLNKEGSIIPAQLYELKGQLANDQLAVINNRNAAESAKLMLSQLMNVAYDKKMTVEKVSAENLAKYEGDLEKIYQDAVSQLSIIKAAELRKESAAAGVKVARGEFYPSLSLSGNVFTNYSDVAQRDIFLNSTQVPSGDYVLVSGNQLPVITNKSNFRTEDINYTDQFKNNYSTQVNVNLRIPLFNGFQARNRVALAKNELKNADLIAETSKIQLRQSIEQNYLNMTAAYERYTALLQQVEDFREAFKIADVRFQEGASNQVDYLIAKNNFDRAQINLIIARYDYILRTKILDYYKGNMAL